MAAPVVKRCFRIETAGQIDDILVDGACLRPRRGARTGAGRGVPGGARRPGALAGPSLSATGAESAFRQVQLELLVARLAGCAPPAPPRRTGIGRGRRTSAGAWPSCSGPPSSRRSPVAACFPTIIGSPLAAIWESGIEPVNELIGQADLVLALGCKFSHNGTAGFGLRIAEAVLVHVDASPEVLEANYPASMAIEADVPALLQSVLERLPARRATGRRRMGMSIASTRRSAILERRAGPEPEVYGEGWGAPAVFFDGLRAALPRNAILVTDSGRHQALARRHYPVFSPRGFLAPSDFQSMGFGLPGGHRRRRGRSGPPGGRADRRRRAGDVRPGARHRRAGTTGAHAHRLQ